MSAIESFVIPKGVWNIGTDYNRADYVILGVPMDITGTYRTGTRFAPAAIREAMMNIETYSFRTKMDVDDLDIFDIGDLQIVGNAEENLKRLEMVVKQLLGDKKLPAIIGGEHLITLGVMQAVGEDSAIVSFDAHLDMRNEYNELSISHATHMRRVIESVFPQKVLEIGIRSVSKEELDFVKKVENAEFLTSYYIREKGIKKTSKKIHEILEGIERIYITVDMDVLDPSFAPAVANPEPEGLDMSTLLDILYSLSDERLVGFDVVEVAPHYDMGITAIQAAKVVHEVLACQEVFLIS